MHDLCHIWDVAKNKTTPYNPKGNGVVERGNKGLRDALRTQLLNRHETDWGLVLPHIMQFIRSTPHGLTQETPNFLMLGRELNFLDTLISGLQTEIQTREHYAIELAERLKVAYESTRNYQAKLRSQGQEEPLLFSHGDKVC